MSNGAPTLPPINLDQLIADITNFEANLLPLLTTFFPQLAIAKPFIPIVLALLTAAKQLEASGIHINNILPSVQNILQQIGSEMQALFPAAPKA